ncbi:MAG TPA: FAD-dependent thymidylate synthase [Thermoanaerobaculia bacterium]|nr:FAD-dependent thymidylate synthase [Thermoanaerobaculia bacterium]
MSTEFTPEETARLAPFFTNVDAPVFGLKLPQEVAGALFSRYSRTSKSLRRVFLDEFVGEQGLAEGLLGGGAVDDGEALQRARAFYDRVLVGYGDDSVAQLGAAHVAVERVSNVAAQTLEDARVGISFLEKSTRYVRFDQKGADGSFLWHREGTLLASRHGAAFAALMDRLFGTYAEQIDPMIRHIEEILPIESVDVRHPKTGEPLAWNDVARDPELLKAARRAYGATVRAHACDVMRSYLPGATLTNLGVFATGQAFEHLLNRLYSSPLAECAALGGAMHAELRRLIPSFVKRAKRSDWLCDLDARSRGVAARVLPPGTAPERTVTLLDYDPDGEAKVLAALLYPYADLPLAGARARVAAMPAKERAALHAELAGGRRNRRDKPPRALEETSYAFDLLGNFGMYRDLHRHRLLSQERQPFTTVHGWATPPEIVESGCEPAFRACMEEAHELHEAVAREHPHEAQYVVPFAFKVRWRVTLNLREAVHLCELRSMPQGHPDYRLVAQEIWRRIEEVHPALAPWGGFLNRDTYRLGRLQSEMRTEWKRAGSA